MKFYKKPKNNKINVLIAKIPPWIKYPTVPANSIEWRLGGEPDQYLAEFRKWWETLNEEQRNAFREIYPAPESWRTFCHQNGGSFFYDASDTMQEDTFCGNNQEPFFELFKKTESVEDVIQLVSDFVKKYETRADGFWRRAETALLTALCIRIFEIEGKERCKEMLERFWVDLEQSDREKRNAKLDGYFADLQVYRTLISYNAYDEQVKAYVCFLGIAPSTQRLVIDGCQSLFVREIVENR